MTARALLGIGAALGVIAVLAVRPRTRTATVVTDPHGSWGLLDRTLTPQDVEYQP